MVDALRELVMAESPSSDVDATTRCADVVAKLGSSLLRAQPERLESDGRAHLSWGDRCNARVLLLGHFDTVWPVGTTQSWPFEVKGHIATGPGSFDMKAGIVQGLFALCAVGSLDGVAILLTSDEELGAPTSRSLIEESARGKSAVLVLEPAAAGALKTARKGVSQYRVEARGLAAHAGLEPEKGRNALTELARQILALDELASRQTTVTPTTARAGSAANTVPALASMTVDVRAFDPSEQERVDRELRALRASDADIEIVVERTMQSPPFPTSASRELFARAQRVAKTLGIGPLAGVEVGGGSDGNYTAAVGTPTLDGLGPVGDGAHAEGEHVVIDAMAERSLLVAALVADLLAD